MSLRRIWALFVITLMMASGATAATAVTESKEAKGPLFAKGAETFQLVETSGKPLKREVLSDSPAKQALAAAVVQYLNSKPETNPKVPMQGGIPVHFEKLTFTPEGKDELVMSARVSGHDLDVDQKINRQDFVSGKAVSLKFDPVSKNLSPFEMQFRGGVVRLRWDAKQNLLLIEEGKADLDFVVPFAGNGTESLRLSGRGKRL